MKSFSFVAFLIGTLVFGTSCERHPASETIPGYEEKQAASSKNNHEKKIAPAAQAPTFFHSEKSSNSHE